MRLHRLLVVEDPSLLDWVLAGALAREVLSMERPEGMHPSLWNLARECSEKTLEHPVDWYQHLMTVLALVQYRHPSMEDAEVIARVELERILDTVLYRS